MTERDLVVAGQDITPAREALSGPWRSTKRGVDIAGAALMLLALIPFLLLIALAVRVDSKGPVVFRQRRIGRGGTRFTLLKFRTMTADASPELHERYIAELVAEGGTGKGLNKLTDDPRVTRVGAVLRRTSLDELPQLVNVLLGHMSVVGPRPALDYELRHYEPAHFDRFAVRPGLTGLWQVSGRNELDFREMLDLDVEYVHSGGPATDAKILVRTPGAVFRGRAA